MRQYMHMHMHMHMYMCMHMYCLNTRPPSRRSAYSNGQPYALFARAYALFAHAHAHRRTRCSPRGSVATRRGTSGPPMPSLLPALTYLLTSLLTHYVQLLLITYYLGPPTNSSSTPSSRSRAPRCYSLWPTCRHVGNLVS